MLLHPQTDTLLIPAVNSSEYAVDLSIPFKGRQHKRKNTFYTIFDAFLQEQPLIALEAQLQLS